MRRQKISKVNGLAKPSVGVEVSQPEAVNVPILSQELELLDGHIDDVVAFVVKHGKLDDE